MDAADNHPAPMGPRAVRWLGLGLLATGGLTVLLLVAVWPAVEEPPAHVLSRNSALLVVVVLASALGGFVHAATSFATYVGNRRLTRSWLWWYLLRMITGVALAILFYFVVRGGLISGQDSAANVNPYGIAALASLVGLFSKQATDKLREISETMFRTGPGFGDDARKDKAGAPG